MNFGFQTPFRFGSVETNLEKVFGKNLLKKINQKFISTPALDLAVGCRELAKYLLLCAHSQSEVFFPGNLLIDEIWHVCIAETEEYRALCNRLRIGHFVDHNAKSFDDHLSEKKPQAVLQEQLSTLISYISNFGEIDQAAFSALNLARYFSKLMGFTECSQLNNYLVDVLNVSQKSESDVAGFERQIEEHVFPFSDQIDSDPYAAKIAASKVMGAIEVARRAEAHLSSGAVLPTQAEFELIFAASPCLGFLLAQHFSAVNRLTHASEWKSQNPELWNQIAAGQFLVGLATTHLVNPQPHHITIKESKIYGVAPWSSGYGVFDKLVLGARTDQLVSFLLVDYPVSGLDLRQRFVTVDRFELRAFNGTSSVQICFDGLPFVPNQIISQYSGQLRPSASSPYLLPEIGILSGLMQDIEKAIGTSSSLRLATFKDAYGRLWARASALREKRSQLHSLVKAQAADLEDLQIEFENLMRGAVRMLTLISGGSSLESRSRVARRQLELLWIDATPSSPTVLARRIELCVGIS